MAITVENTGSDGTSTSSSSFALDYGFTTTVDRLLIAAVVTKEVGTLSDDGNWTEIGQGDSSSQTTGVWWKIETSASTSATWTKTGSNGKWCGVIIEISGHDSSTPIDGGSGAPTTAGGDTIDISPATLTPTVDNCLIFNGGGVLNYKIMTVESGYTDTNMNITSTSGGAVSMIGAYLQQSTKAATGTVEHDLNSIDDWWAWNIAVKPASGNIAPQAMGLYRIMQG